MKLSLEYPGDTSSGSTFSLINIMCLPSDSEWNVGGGGVPATRPGQPVAMARPLAWTWFDSVAVGKLE